MEFILGIRPLGMEQLGLFESLSTTKFRYRFFVCLVVFLIIHVLDDPNPICFLQVIKSEMTFYTGNALQIRGFPLFHKLGHPLDLYRLLHKIVIISLYNFTL